MQDQDETGEYSFGSFLNFNYDAYKQNLRHQEELAKVVANLLIENALLREALRPFAYSDIDNEWKDEDDINIHAMVGDARKARKMLERGDE